MTAADRTIHAIDSVIDAHEAAYHPGIACPETQEGRCALARPVESPEDRMRDARTDRTFATYLDATERDQLDAKAACAQQERDEALDDRDQARRERDQNAADLQATANTNDQLRDQLADMTDQRNERLTLAESSRLAKRYDAAEEERDDYARRLDEARRTIAAQTAQLRANRTLLDRLRELGELTDRAWAEHDTNADREYAALSFTDAVCDTCHLLKIDHTDGPCQSPALGSPPPRAQEPGREEVRWAYRWLDADGNVHDEVDTRDNARETAEDRARRLARNRPPSIPAGQVVRYRVVTTEEVVATYPAEREG